MHMKALFAVGSLCAGLVLGAVCAPAWAQTPTTGQPAPPAQPGAAPPTAQKPPPPSPAPGAVNEVVVTGSRIKTTNFNSPDPLTVITSEQAQLTGNVDTGQILQLSAVAANAVQINNFFTGFLTTGGPGVNTLSLRGLGAQRTLFLLDGERLGPAGVGGTVGPFDLNVIPASMIDHIDILKDGASSIYGSDAVSGVVNIITKTNEDGGDITVYGNPSEHGGGATYQVNASYGKTFDKGYITVGFDFYQQQALTYGERSYFNCAKDLVKYLGGGSADLTDPLTGSDKCENILTDTVVDEGVYNGFVEYAADPKAAIGGNFGLNLPGWNATGLQFCGSPPTLCFGGPTTNVAATRASMAAVPENDPLYSQTDAISPDTRYTFTLFAGYDLTPHAQLYTSVLLNQRDSEQTSVDQLFGLLSSQYTPAGNNPFNAALGPNPGTGCTGFCFPVPVLLQVIPTTQTVDYARVVLGVKGDLPNIWTTRNWTYDLYGQYSESDGSYTQRYIPTDRANAIFGAGAGSNGCDVNAVAPFSSPGPGNEPMSVQEPGVACVPVNLIEAAMTGALTPAESSFLYKNETGHTTYDYGYVEGSATGDLFQLPAGPLGAAIGFHVRHESIDDVPGPDTIDNNVYNYTTEGVTKGSENVEELFGELRIPIVKDLPFLYSVDADVSGRLSDYSTYGANTTYKGTFDWKINDWFAVRATYGTAFRAPALYELYLANQTGFYNQIGVDPCIEYGTSGVNALIQKNCASQGIPSTYDGQGESLTVLSGGGANEGLKPETSIAETAGVVLTPRLWGQTINLTVDYYSFNIANQIQQFGVSNIAYVCYNSEDFGPKNPFCAEITRNGPTANGNASPYNIEQILNPYVNISDQVDQGLDVNLNWQTALPKEVKLTVMADLAWTFYTQTVLDGFVVNNYLGQIGSPRFDGNLDFKFDRGPWTFNWYFFMIGHSSDDPFSDPTDLNYHGTGQTVYADYVVPFYTTSDISLRRKFDKFVVVAGIKNLFNQGPPAISAFDANNARLGDSPLVSQYDFIGRSYYLSLEAKF
jgi:iron complex outermembrane receptor protein